MSFYPDAALGHEYGSSFKVEKQMLHSVNKSKKEDPTLIEGRLGHAHSALLQKSLLTFGKLVKCHLAVRSKHQEGECGTDNRRIQDDGASQELTEGDIRTLKGEGMSGQGIIASMIKHSTTFKDKTKYSQEKYIRKKKMKYIPMVRIIRPTTKLLCELYFTQSPSKIYYLRKDSLARILAQSNVHAHSNMMVMEMCQGLLVGAMLERMGGYGKLVQVFYADNPVRTVLEKFGHLSQKDLSILLMYPLHRVGSLLKGEETHLATASLRRLLGEGTFQAKPVPSRKAKVMIEEKELKDDEAAGDTDCVAAERTEDIEEPPLKRVKIESCVSSVGDDGLDGNYGGVLDAGLLSSIKVEESAKEEPSFKIKHESLAPEIDELSASLQDTEGGFGSGGAGRKDDTAPVTRGKDDASNDVYEQADAKRRKKLEREEAYRVAGELLSQRKMDGLVVVCRHHPEPVVMALIHFLAPSRPIVVYCHLIEPLVQCYKTLKESGLVFQMQISETWMRHYQVLDERTHPEMSMDGQSGFILTAIRINQIDD